MCVLSVPRVLQRIPFLLHENSYDYQIELYTTVAAAVATAAAAAMVFIVKVFPMQKLHVHRFILVPCDVCVFHRIC